jgi:hypothetical protein
MRRRRTVTPCLPRCRREQSTTGGPKQPHPDSKYTRNVTHAYTTLAAAAALARATAAHLAEALAECEQLTGYGSARELAPYVLDAHLLSNELARMAALEGGQP